MNPLSDLAEIPRLDRIRSYPPVPMPVWLLLGLGIVDVVLQVLGQGVVGPAPYRSVTIGYAFGLLQDVMPFLLAAALVAGVTAWPAGRGQLLGGAGLYVVAGLLFLGFDAWWAVGYWSGSGPDASLTTTTWISRLALARAAAQAAAALLVGVGLWRCRPDGPVLASAWRWLAVAVLLVAAAAAVEHLVLLGRVNASAAQTTDYTPALVLEAIGSLAMGCLGAAALACMPPVGWLPERMMAIGAGLAVLMDGASGLLEVTVSMDEPTSPLYFNLYGWFADGMIVGLVILGVGLALGRVVAPRPVVEVPGDV